MKIKEYPQKSLVWITLVVIALVIIVASMTTQGSDEAVATINTEGQPTLGNPAAPIHIVVFKEPKCSSCRDFDRDIYPKLKKEYIDTGKVKFTMILVSFLPDSMPAAVAMLCVYDDNPENTALFFQYASYLYNHQPDEKSDWAKTPLLVDFARKTSPKIDLKRLESCIASSRYAAQIDKNTVNGTLLMDGLLSTPRVYVNGVEIKETNYTMLSNTLQDILNTRRES